MSQRNKSWQHLDDQHQLMELNFQMKNLRRFLPLYQTQNNEAFVQVSVSLLSLFLLCRLGQFPLCLDKSELQDKGGHVILGQPSFLIKTTLFKDKVIAWYKPFYIWCSDSTKWTKTFPKVNLHQLTLDQPFFRDNSFIGFALIVLFIDTTSANKKV